MSRGLYRQTYIFVDQVSYWPMIAVRDRSVWSVRKVNFKKWNFPTLFHQSQKNKYCSFPYTSSTQMIFFMICGVLREVCFDKNHTQVRMCSLIKHVMWLSRRPPNVIISLHTSLHTSKWPFSERLLNWNSTCIHPIPELHAHPSHRSVLDSK